MDSMLGLSRFCVPVSPKPTTGLDILEKSKFEFDNYSPEYGEVIFCVGNEGTVGFALCLVLAYWLRLSQKKLALVFVDATKQEFSLRHSIHCLVNLVYGHLPACLLYSDTCDIQRLAREKFNFSICFVGRETSTVDNVTLRHLNDYVSKDFGSISSQVGKLFRDLEVDPVDDLSAVLKVAILLETRNFRLPHTNLDRQIFAELQTNLQCDEELLLFLESATEDYTTHSLDDLLHSDFSKVESHQIVIGIAEIHEKMSKILREKDCVSTLRNFLTQKELDTLFIVFGEEKMKTTRRLVLVLGNPTYASLVERYLDTTKTPLSEIPFDSIDFRVFSVNRRMTGRYMTAAVASSLSERRKCHASPA